MAIPSTLSQARPSTREPISHDEAWVLAGVAGAGALLLLLTLKQHRPAPAAPPAVSNQQTLPPIQSGPGDTGAAGDCGCS